MEQVMEGGASNFGGQWTVKKLDAVEKYLRAYTTALKNRPFNLTYIDAFAGSGRWLPPQKNTRQGELFDIEPMDGSVICALKKPFHSYLLIEKESQFIDRLNEVIKDNGKDSAAVIKQDANKVLPLYCDRMKPKDRAVCFLDPYGSEVEWNTLKAIADTGKIDMWYLFPYSNLLRSSKLSGSNERLRKLLNLEPGRLDLGDGDIDSHWSVIKQQFETIFPAVAEKPLILRNSKKAPMFMLCFAISNHDERAQKIALRMAQHILKS